MEARNLTHLAYVLVNPLTREATPRRSSLPGYFGLQNESPRISVVNLGVESTPKRPKEANGGNFVVRFLERVYRGFL